MCDKCKDKTCRIYDHYGLEERNGMPQVNKGSRCLYCGKKFIDFYMLRHIGTRIEGENGFEEVKF